MSGGGGGESDTKASLSSSSFFSSLSTLQAHHIIPILIYSMSFLLIFSNYIPNLTGSGFESVPESRSGFGPGSESGSKLFNLIFDNKTYSQMTIRTNFYHSEEHRYGERLTNRRKMGFFSGSSRHRGSGTLIKNKSFHTNAYR